MSISVANKQTKQLERAESVNGLQFAEVSAIITRKDGTVENLGVIDRFETPEHELERLGIVKPSLFARAKGLLSKVLPIVSIIVLAHAALGGHHRYLDPTGQEVLVPSATVIVNGGQAIVTNLVSGLGGTVPKFVAWGTGAGTAGVTDTTLFTESTDESRTSGTVSRVTTTVTNDTYQVVGTITVATSNKTITNVGLFDASTSGNLYFKSDFTGLALNIGDSISFTIKSKFS